MRPGIRVQILLALAGLLVLAFVPLFFAVASLTRSSLQNTRDSTARSLGRAIAAHVSDARRVRDPARLDELLQAEIGTGGLAAIAVYADDGRMVARAGPGDEAGVIPPVVPVDEERTRTVFTPHGRALEVLVPGHGGPVVALLRADDEAMRATPLVRLVALYTGFFALALLVFAYMALTHLIVRPLDELSEAARRVSIGARDLAVPRAGARELAQLASSLAEMTARLRAEEQELRRKIDALEVATEDLKRAQGTLVRSERLASVGRLAAGLAHEIGNPISAILGLQELLLAGGLEPDEQHDFLERMKRETERIHRVLRQLLDFARPAASVDVPGDGKAPGSVSDAVQDACALIRPQKSFREVALEVDVASDLPLVPLSREQLVQVLLNLLLNAGDATGGRGHVWVRASRRDERVRIEVQDDGPGIHRDVRDKLFEPFVTTKEIGTGTGLGLAVCRGIIEAADGTIVAEEPERAGARFVIDLPAAAPG